MATTAGAASTPSSALLFQSTNPGTALGGRQQRSSTHDDINKINTKASSTTVVAAAAGMLSSPSSPPPSSSSSPRLFKSDAANNYYNAMRMKHAMKNANSNNNSNMLDQIDAPSNANTVVAAAGLGNKEKGIHPGEPKKTTFATTTTAGAAGCATTLQKNDALALSPFPGGGVVIPPITSFDWSCAGGDHRDILSATSSITHCDSFHQTDSFCSIATEEVTAAAAAAAAAATTATSAVNGSKDDTRDSERNSDDPPIAEYPSPVCISPDDSITKYYGSCSVHEVSVVVPKELKLDVIDEGCFENGGSSSNNSNKEVDGSVEQDLQSYQAMSSSSTMMSKMKDTSSNAGEVGTSSSGRSATNAENTPRDEISLALNVVDALSVIGPVSKSPPPVEKSNSVSPTMKLRSVRSMSPSLFKKKKKLTNDDGKGEKITSSTTTTSSAATTKSIVPLPPASKNVSTAKPSTSTAPRACKITVRSARSMSPSFSTTSSEQHKKEEEKEEKERKNPRDSTGSDDSTAASTVSAGTDPAEVPREDERIDSSVSSAIEKRVTNEKKQVEAKGTKRALPPLIPSRAIAVIDPPRQPKQIITSSDDDGSVECSVKVVSDDKEPAVASLTNGGNELQIVENESAHFISETISDDHSTAESSLFNDLEAEVATPRAGNVQQPTKLVIKGRKERALEKLARRQPKVVVSSVKGKDTEEKSATAYDGIHSSTSEEKSNITSSSNASDTNRKKERLQKIMNYRKKASPAPERKAPQKTLDAWLVPREKKEVEKVNETTVETSNAEMNVKTESISKRDQMEVVVMDGSHYSKQKNVENVQNESQSKRTVQEAFVAAESDRSKKTKEQKKERSQARTSKHAEMKMKKTAFVEGSELTTRLRMQQQQQYSKPIAQSRDFSAPITRIDVLQTAYSTDTGISLPPELLNGKKVRIWHESETFDEGASKEENVEALADVFMTCGKPKIGDDDMFTYDIMNTEINSIIDERKAWCSNNDDESMDTKEHVSMCGVDTHQLKKDILFEVNEAVREVEGGLRRSMRNLFLTCDITQSGGVEAVTSNVANTNDQIFGRAPMPTKRAQPVSHGKDANQTVKKSTLILDSEVAARMNVSPKKTGKKNGEPITADEKRNMYVAKLRAVALKHM